MGKLPGDEGGYGAQIQNRTGVYMPGLKELYTSDANKLARLTDSLTR